MKDLQWFPGHMAKTKRQVKEKLKLVDFVIEVLDARAPQSSENPMIDEIVKHKPRMVVLTKRDLADPSLVKKWLSYYEKKGYKAIAVNVFNAKEVMSLVPLSKEVAHQVLAKEARQGRALRPLRAMVLGIPNVGKSTLINQLVKKRVLNIGDRPGVTKNVQMIRIHKELELMDTPGILWPKFEDQEVAKKLALLGTLKDHLIPLDEIAIYGLRYIKNYHEKSFIEKFGFDLDLEDIPLLFENMAKKLNMLKKHKEPDYDRVIERFIYDFRASLYGKVMLDR